MRLALFLLGITLVGLAALAASRGIFLFGLQRAGQTFAKLLPILGVSFLLAGFAEALLPQGFVERWLSDAAGLRGIVIAWIAGAITPGAALLGMPLAAGLLQAGAGAGVLVTYLTSMALLPLMRLPMELGIYGGRLAALRITSSLLLPPVAGFVAQLVSRVLHARS